MTSPSSTGLRYAIGLGSLGVMALVLPLRQATYGSLQAVESAIPNGPTIIRVGLATDELTVVLEDSHGLEVSADDRRVIEAARRLTVRPAGTLVHPWTYRLQVAAMREPRDVERMASDLERTTGLTPDLAFDAETGLTRIRLGAWQHRAEAEQEQARLKARGRDAWIVEEPGRIANGGLTVSTPEGSLRTGSEILVRRSDGGPIAWNHGRYRGVFELRLNRRGELNVILHSDLEDYLRGVVPREMGPRIYDDIEALKAQAVAARSYVLHNLGEFAAEGFDVCATTRCQVFGGTGAEHPLTDRAVTQTAGLVLMTADGRSADTLYTATCGGHTEDVSTVFPAKRHDYLRGVPCVEAGRVRVANRATWTLIESRAVRALVGELGSDPPEIGESFFRLLERAAIPAAEDRLASFEREEVLRFLGSALDLVADPAWLTGRSAPQVDASPLARTLHTLATGGGGVPVATLRRILYQVAETTGLVDGAPIAFAGRDASTGEVRVRGDRAEWLLPPETPWHWRGSDRSHLAAAGDPLHLILVADAPLAVLVPTRPRRSDTAAPPTRTWREFRSDADLSRRAALEFPGFRYQTLEFGDRGVSGRLESLRLNDGNGDSRRLEGLAIRWFLDIPETWFQARRASGRSGSGWVFSGRGWGHGVGMCQRGAYRMSLRGARFDEILDYYYTGLELGLYGQL